MQPARRVGCAERGCNARTELLPGAVNPDAYGEWGKPEPGQGLRLDAARLIICDLAWQSRRTARARQPGDARRDLNRADLRPTSTADGSLERRYLRNYASQQGQQREDQTVHGLAR